MCLSLPGRVLSVNGAMAEVEIDGRRVRCNALARPEVTAGDYVLIHANLIVAIIEEAEAQEMFQAARELDDALARDSSSDQDHPDNTTAPANDDGGARKG